MTRPEYIIYTAPRDYGSNDTIPYVRVQPPLHPPGSIRLLASESHYSTLPSCSAIVLFRFGVSFIRESRPVRSDRRARKIHDPTCDVGGTRAKKKEDPEDIVHPENTAVGTTNYCTFYFVPT